MDNIKDKKLAMGSVIIIAIIFAGAGFFAGRLSQKSAASPAGLAGNFQQMRGSGQTAGLKRTDGASMISGEVIKIDDSSLTIKGSDNNSKVVYFSDNTVVNQMATSSINTITAGQQVTVSGQEDTSGFITATSIQVRDGAIGEGMFLSGQGGQMPAGNGAEVPKQ